MKAETCGGIEYIQAPPPILKKAMEWRYARQLLVAGRVRLANILEYRKPNQGKPWQTDPYEDVEIEVRGGMRCRASSMSPPFIWCCAASDADPMSLLEIDTEYDTIVTIVDTVAFFCRLATKIRLVAPGARFQAGLVAYNKEREATPYFWGKCAFQKHEAYSYQKEYRFASHEPPGGLSVLQGRPFIKVELGACESILRIEKYRLAAGSRRLRNHST